MSAPPVTLTGDGDSVTVSRSASVPPPTGWTLQSKGVSGIFSLGAATSFGLGKYYDPATLSGVMSQLNATAMRDVMEWKKLETTVGVYNWSSSYGLHLKQWLTYLKVAPRVGIVTVCNAGTLYSDFQWGGPPTAPSGVVHWQNYVKSVVQNCSPLGCHNYELWNEVNVPSTGGWGGTRQQFIDLIKPTYDIMKSVDSQANLTLGAIINPNNSTYDNGHGTPYQWLTDIAKADYSQMPDTRISYHNYYDGSKTIDQRTPEQFHAEDIATHGTIAAYRNWETTLTEVGWYTTGAKAVTEDTRALYWSRYPFLLRCVPGLRIVSAWEMAAMTSPEYALYNSSLVASPGATAFGYAAAQVNAATDASHSTRDTSHLVSMNCPDRRYAVWDQIAKQVPVAINAQAPGTLTMTNMATGAKTITPIAAGAQTINVTIGPAALLITGSVPIAMDV